MEPIMTKRDLEAHTALIHQEIAESMAKQSWRIVATIVASLVAVTGIFGAIITLF